MPEIRQNEYINSPLGAVWRGWTHSSLCADIPNIGFMSFESVDHCVNWLYVNDHKELARLVNKTFKTHEREI